MKVRKQRRVRKVVEINKRGCFFCKTKTVPYWRDDENLAGYLSPRARIIPRAKTGVCAKHQRRLAEAVKHDRFLGLLPFITQLKS